MEAPSALLFRIRDWPIARALIEARQLPPIFDELAGYLYAPEHCARSTLDEKLPEGTVEPQLVSIVMDVLELVTEVALDCFGHHLFPEGPIGRKHFGFHPSAPYEALVSRFERDGFRVLHAAELVGATGPDAASLEAARARVRAFSKTGLSEREAALVDYVRGGGAMPPAGVDQAPVALALGRLVTPRFEQWGEVDGRILDVACAAGEVRGPFEVFAARVNAHEENGHDTYGALRRELTRRGIADGRILVALLRAGVEPASSATLHVVSRYAQLDALVDAVRSNETSRAEQARLIERLLTWMSCVGASPAAVDAVTAYIESSRAKELPFEELRAHLAATHGWEGPKAKGRGRAKKAEAEPEATAKKADAPAKKADAPAKKAEAVEAPAPAAPAAPAAPVTTADDAAPEAPKKGRAKAAKADKADKAEPRGPVPLAQVNETLTFGKGVEWVALAEPGAVPDDEEALVDAVNRKALAAFRCDVARALTVRVTGKNLTAQEADHAYGSHHWYGVKTGVDALELRAGAEAAVVAVEKGRYGVEVVAVRAPKGSALPDYVLLLRDEAPARLAKRAELTLIETR